MTVLVLMGVAGCGKTTEGVLLAERLDWPFLEGDSLHPRSNVEKMESGQPLTDEDRWPWLEKIAGWMDERAAAGENGIVTCSALKRSYRDLLGRDRDVTFVYLHGTFDTLRERMESRRGHFMPVSMLESQLETLEEPTPDESAIWVGVDQAPEVIADEVVERLGLGEAQG